MKSRKVLLPVLMSVVAMTLIAGRGGPAAAQKTDPPKASSAALKQPAEWDQLVEEANQEGKLIVFGQANNSFRGALIAGFNKQYPKIKIEYRSGTQNADIVSKISAERRAGVHELDLVLWGANAIYGALMPAGYIAPIKDLLVLEDLKDPQKWAQGKLQYADNEEKYIATYILIQGSQILVNKNMVDVSQLKSYEDLLDPKYSGKIVVAHPKDVGQARYAFGFFYDYYGEDYFRKLAAQKPAVIKNAKQLIDWVAHGKYAIGISPGNIDAYKELMDSGIPIVGMQLREGGYYSPGYNNVAIVKDAPHPNATKLFANWIFTKEGQEVVIEATQGSSVRTDVSNPLQFDKGKKYFAPHLQKNEGVQKKAVETFDKYFKQ